MGYDPIGTSIANTLYSQLNWSQYKLLISMGNSKDTKIRGLGRVGLKRACRMAGVSSADADEAGPVIVEAEKEIRQLTRDRM